MYVVSVTEALEECVGVIQDNCSMSSLYFQHFLNLHTNGIGNSPPSLFVWVENRSLQNTGVSLSVCLVHTT